MIQDEYIYGTIKEIKGFLGEDLGLSSEERKNSSELLFPGSVGNSRLLPGDPRFPRERLGSTEMCE